MNVTDPIADTLTRIRNAGTSRHLQVSMPNSKMREAIARLLKDEGFIEKYEVLPGKVSSTLKMSLKYSFDRQKKPVINGLKRISKPGRREYIGKKDIPRVRSGLGIAIMSTSYGVMTGEQARRKGIGGELLCYIW